MHKYEVIIYWSAEDEAFVANVPELPGCMAHGATQEEALAQGQQAVQLWIDDAREFGDLVPEPKGHQRPLQHHYDLARRALDAIYEEVRILKYVYASDFSQEARRYVERIEQLAYFQYDVRSGRQRKSAQLFLENNMNLPEAAPPPVLPRENDA